MSDTIEVDNSSYKLETDIEDLYWRLVTACEESYTFMFNNMTSIDLMLFLNPMFNLNLN